MSKPYTPYYGRMGYLYSGSSGSGSLNDRVFVGASSSSGSNNPNYRRNIAKHINAGSNYDVFWVKSKPGTAHGSDIGLRGTAGDGKGSSGNCWYEAATNTNIIGLPAGSQLENQVVDQHRSQARNYMNQWKALVPLVELREFYRTVRSTAKLTNTMLDRMIEISGRNNRKSRRRGKRYNQHDGWLNEASDAWLTYSFGIKPMINDSENAAKAIAYKLHQSQDRTIRVSTSSSSLSFQRGQVFSLPCSAIARAAGVTSILVTDTVGLHSGFLERVISSNNFNDVRDFFGLTLGDLPSVLWELTPYSWAVDYFTNVGAFLDNTFTNLPGYTYYSYMSRKRVMEYILNTSITNAAPSAYKVQGGGGSATVTVGRFNRSALSAVPNSQLRFKSVDEVGLHSVNKVLNLASVLINQRVR